MVLVLLATILGVGVLTLMAVVQLASGARERAVLTGGAAAGWLVLYAGGLLGVSLTSREAVLPPGTSKPFCGLYLDCHLGVAVLSDSTVTDIGEHHARGIYHIVTLRFTNSARRATLAPHDLDLVLLDGSGRRYAPDMGARSNLVDPRPTVAIEQAIPPGGAYTDRVVFDLPPDAGPLRLLAREGPTADRLLELVLLGDEDSFLHRKTLLRVGPD